MEDINLYRRNGKKVYIKQPTFQELEYTASLWGHRETMSEIGGAYFFAKEKWSMFYKKMVYPTDGKNFYCLVYTTRDNPVGEVSFHGFDSVTRVARVNVKIHSSQRNKGYGEEALRLLLEYYFNQFGGSAIIDTPNTIAAIKIFENIGFEEISKFRNKVTFKLTKDRFLNECCRTSKNISIICYDGMDLTNYSIVKDIFTLTNQLLNKELFKITTVGRKSQAVINENIIINLDSTFEEIEEKPDIIIITGGMGAKAAVKDESVIKYLLSNYNECDYLLSAGKAILFLIRGNMIEGLICPRIDGVEKEMLEVTSRIQFSNSSCIDGGKILMVSNSIAVIKGAIEIVKKVAGENLAQKVAKLYGQI